MTPERWCKVEELYHSARERGPDGATAFLEQACGVDSELKREVMALLAQNTEVQSVLDRPAWELADPLGETALDEGKQYGAYRIESQIGRGGMGVVYRAVDTRLGRPVAIKVSGERYSDHFECEARAVAALNHPHICTLYDVGPDYLVMEFIEGETLRDRLRNGPIPVTQALEYAAQIADALAEAHAHGVIHRDLKPANIMLTKNGAKVLDFGIARRITPGDRDATETIAVVMGTPAYMSPEQAAGKPAGPEADLFSLGLILYEMLAARLPVPGASLGATLDSGAQIVIPALRRTGGGVPAGVDPLLHKLLERNPECRPRTAVEVKQQLVNLNRDRTMWTRRVAVAAVLTAVAAGAWSLFRPVPRPAAGPVHASVAVLPFVNRTGETGVEYLVDGMTADLIRRLALIPQLRVISAASVMALKGKDLTPSAAAQRLGVDTIISGSIGGSGKSATMDVEVSHGADGSVFFARHYAPHEPELFRLLSTVAEDLTAGMKIRLERGIETNLKKQLTDNPVALDLYLKAGPLFASDVPPKIFAAADLLTRAIQEDPKFALATQELASVHINLGTYYDDPRKHMPIAKALALRALEFDETLEEPHAILGGVALVYEWDYDEARRQLILSSGRMQSSALQFLGCTTHLMSMSGRWNHDAEDEVRFALQANPISAMLVAELGCTAYYARKYDRALQGFTRALTIQPASINGIWGLGKTYAQMGKFQEALDALDRAPSADGMLPPIILGEQGYIYGRMNNRQPAQLILTRLDEMSRKVFVDPFFRAEVYLGLGNTAKCVEALNDAFATRSAILISIHSDPKWEPIKADPRFQALAARIGG
jgi:TolB-like protein/predicted Ser/Thr protein kinase